jgi:fructoselysine/glucoselysine PTS system EIIA component
VKKLPRTYVISHGDLSIGLVDALKIIIGDNVAIVPIAAFKEELSSHRKIKEKIEQLVRNLDEETVIFLDLLGGSITNDFVKSLDENTRLHLVTGVNLPMLLEYYLRIQNGEDCKQAIIQSIHSGKENIRYLS